MGYNFVKDFAKCNNAKIADEFHYILECKLIPYSNTATTRSNWESNVIQIV